jgi:hypothetical protein
MIYEDICTKRVYKVNNVEKVSWLKCGTLRTNDAGKRYIELNQNPDVTLYVFPKKEKENNPEQTTEQEWLGRTE